METLQKYFMIALLVSSILPFIAVILFPTTQTVWNVYYDKRADDVFYEGRIPDFDEQSYLGRPNTFVPAFFTFKAGFMRLLNLSPGTLTNIAYQIIANSFLTAAIFSLSKTLKFNPRQTVMYWMILVTNNFLISWMIGHYLHLLGFAVFIFALYYYNKTKGAKNDLLIALLVGVSGLLHSIYLVAFPVMAFALGDRNWQRPIRIFFPAGVLFMAVYLRTILLAGIPYAIVPYDWGYYIRGSIEGLLSFTLLWAPVLLIGLYRQWRNVMDDEILAYTAFLTLMIFFFLSFRVNIFMLMLLGVIAVRQLRTELKDNRFWRIIMLVFVLNGTVYGIAHYGTWDFGKIGFLNEWYTDSMPYLQAVPGPVVSDPLFGHPIIYYTSHKVLADLYVEYAYEENYFAAMEFVLKGDFREAECYGVQSALITPRIPESDMDILFSNQHFSVGTIAFQKTRELEQREPFTCPSPRPSQKP